MTLREFNIKMMRDQVLRRIIPLEIRKSYPHFALEDEEVTLSFICFKTANEKGMIYVDYPLYCLKVEYPTCKLLSFDTVKRLQNVTDSHIMLPKEKDKIERLNALCDKAFQAAEDNSSDKEEIFSQYNAVLFDILEYEQRELIEKFINR